MKHILFLSSFFLFSLSLHSQTRDTFNLFQNKKKEKKDAVKEIQTHSQAKQNTVHYVKYGKSKVKCSGYCFHESFIDSVNMITETKPLQADKSYPLKKDTAQTTRAYWDMLINSFEINSFLSIPKKVGNPGVGNENTEWIEIKYADITHKITFDSTGPDEYEGINNLMKILKNMVAF